MTKLKTRNTNPIVYSTHPVVKDTELSDETTELTALPGGPVKIYTEKRSGGKTVTLIKNIPYRENKIEDIIKALKKRCASGGTVREGIIELQGDQKKKAGEALVKMGFKVKIS